jgi:hypothetical protein
MGVRIIGGRAIRSGCRYVATTLKGRGEEEERGREGEDE